MKQVRFSFMRYIPMVLFFLLVSGCKRWTAEGETMVRGTATVNGKEYEDLTRRGWNSEFTPTVIFVHPHYKQFNTAIQLQPKGSKYPSFEYEIEFHIATDDDKQLKADHPYKIEYNEMLETTEFIPNDISRFLIYDKSKITPNGGDGIAVVFTRNNKIPRSMEGEFVFRYIDSQNKNCKGHYLIKTKGSKNSEELTIEGRFEANINESDLHYLNK